MRLVPSGAWHVPCKVQAAGSRAIDPWALWLDSSVDSDAIGKIQPVRLVLIRLATGRSLREMVGCNPCIGRAIPGWAGWPNST